LPTPWNTVGWVKAMKRSTGRRWWSDGHESHMNIVRNIDGIIWTKMKIWLFGFLQAYRKHTAEIMVNENVLGITESQNKN